MVILYDNMPAIEVSVKFLQTEAYQNTLSLSVHVASLNISKGFTGKTNGATALYEGGC